METTDVAGQTDDQDTGLSKRDQEELALFRQLQPLLKDCLKLNHDLNNALTGVLGYAELLLMDKDQLSTEQIENVKQITECAERLSRRLDSLCTTKARLAGEVDLVALIEEWQKIEA